MTTFTTTFIADNSGESLTFRCDDSPASLSIDSVSLKEVTSESSESNFSVKEFLYGNTDEDETIFFRADSQPIQLISQASPYSQFETFSNPIAIVNRTQRGSLVKCFVALDDGDFYELQGTVTKGVSILKVHSKDKKNLPTPPLAREIKVSWRDSSKQLCRLIQTAIIFIPGTMDYSE